MVMIRDEVSSRGVKLEYRTILYFKKSLVKTRNCFQVFIFTHPNYSIVASIKQYIFDYIHGIQICALNHHTMLLQIYIVAF